MQRHLTFLVEKRWMKVNKKMLKPYVGVLLVILCAADIFWLSGLIGRHSYYAQTIVGELLLAVIAVALVLIFRADIKKVFPFGKPETEKAAGTLVFWLGCFIIAIGASSILLVLFPEQMLVTSQQSGMSMGSGIFIVEFILICVLPGICEELAFRGVLQGSLGSIKNKWIVIAIVSVIFGAFHGSVWRFVPTAILGAGMAYLLYETGNMIYNMMFHMINNLMPLLLLRGLSGLFDIYNAPGLRNISEMPAMTGVESMGQLSLMIVGMYMVYGAGAPLLLYMGNYLIHAGEPGYRKGLFPKEKNPLFTVLTVSCFGLMGFGMMLMLVFAVRNM